MIARIYLRCRACGSITLVRFQIGWLNSTPFAIGCCKCRSILRGRLIQDQENVKLKLELENVDDVTETKNFPDPIQEVESSGELPVKRYLGKDVGDFKISPFQNMWGIMGNDTYVEFKKKILSYITFRKDYQAELQTLVDLYAAQNYGKVYEYYSLHFKKLDILDNITNTVNGFYDLVSWVIQLLLPPNYFQNTTERLLEFFFNSIKPKPQQKATYVNYLFDKLNLERVEIDGILLVTNFLKYFDYFLPVICVSYCPESAMKRPLGSKYLITTTDLDTVKQFYSNNFEWICRASTILMGAENIQSRADFNSMPVVPMDKKREVKSLSDYTEANNGMKRHYLDASKNLDPYFGSIIDNEVRNAINHYKTIYNPVTQTIQYFPYKGQKSTTAKNISLIDLTDLVYKQFNLVFSIIILISRIRSQENR
jgi:hypothetical protein